MRRSRKSLFLLRLATLGFVVASGVFIISAIIHKASAADINKSYISEFEIKRAHDGTAPFDDDNEPGNDKDDNNGIVRTFDHVNYNLAYITKLMEGETVVPEGNLMIEFELDVDLSVAEFDQATLNWLLDQKNTYYYEDGTSSSTWDSTKTVTKQVLVGRRHLTVNENGSNAIPGAGSLSAGLYIKAAKNGQKITPKFTIYMEGNDESLHKTITSGTVTVSAAPRYDVQLTRSTNINEPLAYFDKEEGTIATDYSEGAQYGRLGIYGLTVGLYNKTADHGLKGIELPNGDITFDVSLSETLISNGVTRDVTFEDDYSPYVWDYNENTASDINKKGHLGRQMGYISAGTSAAYYIPLNKGGNSDDDYRVYDGGNVSMVRDEIDSNIYHFTVKDYKFNLKNLVFPRRGYGNGATAVNWGANIGKFHATTMQVVLAFPRTVSSTETVRLDVEVSNFKAQTTTQSTNEEMDLTNNKNSRTVVTYPSGSIGEGIRLQDDKNKYISSTETSGDGYASLGDNLKLYNHISYSGDGYVGDINQLVKFDPELVELKGEGVYITSYSPSWISEINDVKTLFAAKPDKTTWIDDKEMIDAIEENLVYFESYDELVSNGYTCVGFLVEIRNSKLYTGTIYYKIDYRAKDTAEPGKVYQYKIEARAWRDTNAIQSWTDFEYSDGVYGLGDPEWTAKTYTEGYITPNYYLHSNYAKAVYENGTMAGGHTNGYAAGQSILIIGAKNRIELTVKDTTESTTGGTIPKYLYDLDKGEREAEFKIHPEINIVSENNESSTSNLRTDGQIKLILPKGLTYITGSASQDPASIAPGANGTTEIIWTFTNQQVGQPMEDITFRTIIGAAGTIDDVRNNDVMEASAEITSTVDKRNTKVEFGNKSTASIAVIKLATSSISKTVAEPLLETGGDIVFGLHYGNSDDDFVEDVRMVDILPYNGDTRGSDFHGAYRVKKLTVDFTDAPKSFDFVKNSVKLYYTTDASYRNLDGAEAILKNSTGKAWTAISGGAIDEATKTIVFDNLNIQNATAIYYSIGDVQAKEYLSADVVLSPVDPSGNLLTAGGSTQQPADIYANNFYEYADNQIGVVTSNNVFSQVVLRTLSGKLWYDKNQNGLQDDDEPFMSNVAVNLVNTDGTTAKDVLGRNFAQVRTNASGEYTFELLGPGEHRVQIAGGDYGLTIKDEGDDDTLDSDATPTVTNGKLTYANIDKVMPAANAMFAYRYDDPNNDAGFTRASIKLNKASNKGEILTGAEFSFGGKKYEALDGHFELTELGSGRFTLTETLAPIGYKISGPWTVVSEVAADGSISARIDGVTAETNGSYTLKDDLNDSSVNSKITKSSTTSEITAKDQNVDYKITYEVEVEDYMGDAKIQVVDHLPLPIIEDESELADGVYDPDELTITWDEDWTSINTYTGESSHTFEYEISLKYDGIVATDRNLHNEVTGSIMLLDTETETTDKSESGSNEDEADTPVKIPGRIRRRFVDKETGEPVCDDLISSDLVGEEFMSEPIVCEGWELVEGPDHDDYVFEEDEQEIIYRYRKVKNPNTAADNLKTVSASGAVVFTVATGLVWFARRRR